MSRLVERFEKEISRKANEAYLNSSDATLFDGVPGVYFLIKNSEIIYVGESGNVANRIKQHKANGIPFDKAVASECRIRRIVLERFCIRHFSPPLNQKGMWKLMTKYGRQQVLNRIVCENNRSAK